MFLSGGVDSSAIAAHHEAQRFDGPVKTFAVGYREAEFSELSYARHVAGAIGTEHHEVVVSMEDFFNALPRLIWHEDEPITWPSSVSLYFVSKLAREHVTVVLTGEGSDEMFGGYARYRHYAMNQRWLSRYRVVPAPLRRFIRAQVATTPLLNATLRRKLQHTFVGREESLESLYLDNFYSAFPLAEQQALFPALPADSPYATFRAILGRAPLAFSPFPHAARRPEDLPGGAAHEAGPDEHGHLHRKPRALPRSRIRRVLHPRARSPEAAQRPGQVHRQEGHRRPGPAARSSIARKWASLPRCASGCSTPGPMACSASCARATDCWPPSSMPRQLDRLIERQRSGAEDATDRLWRLLNLQLWGDLWLTGKREERWDGLMAVAPPRRMKTLWVNTNFMHPTTKGGQIRTLEMLRHLHRRHEIHYVAIANPSPAGRSGARPRILVQSLPVRAPHPG